VLGPQQRPCRPPGPLPARRVTVASPPARPTPALLLVTQVLDIAHRYSGGQPPPCQPRPGVRLHTRSRRQDGSGRSFPVSGRRSAHARSRSVASPGRAPSSQQARMSSATCAGTSRPDLRAACGRPPARQRHDGHRRAGLTLHTRVSQSSHDGARLGTLGTCSRGRQRSIPVAHGALRRAAHLGERHPADPAEAACGLWHARGQGFNPSAPPRI